MIGSALASQKERGERNYRNQAIHSKSPSWAGKSKPARTVATQGHSRGAMFNQEVKGPTLFRQERERRVGAPYAVIVLPASSCYFASSASTSDRTWVPSARTASSAIGLSPNAFRMVGATCRVAARVETVRGLKVGFDTSIMTLVSSWPKPPWSPTIEVLPE